MKYVFAAVLSLAACSSSVGEQLAGSEWKPEGKFDAFVRFEAEGKAVGNGACNGFFGSYEAKGDALTFGPLGSTRKMCAPDVMEFERAFLAGLEATARFERQRTRLTLLDADGKPILKLRQTDWD